MGLFDRFIRSSVGKGDNGADSAAPAPVKASATRDVLCAPVSGRVIRMADVPDPVFSQEVLGKGCAIWPDADIVYSPLPGTITVVMGHAVGISGDDGAEVLVHIGVDTVDMNGVGFTGFVKTGDHVDAGQPLIRMDRSTIRAAGHPDCVVLAVSNTDTFADVELAVEGETSVLAGSPVVTVRRS